MPSRSPPIQVPKVSGRVSCGQLHADACEFGGEVLQDVADGAGVQLVEVVDGVAGLVGGLGAYDAQLVGLPDQVDVSRRAAGRARRRSASMTGVFEEFGDTAQLVEYGAAGGLGGVCGEDGPDVEVLDASRAGVRGRRP